MTDLRKAAEMALNALKISTPVYSPHKFTQALKALEAALAQPEQKSISTNDHLCAMLRQVHDVLACTALPMKRKWVGLTGREIELVLLMSGYTAENFARAIEAKLKEKNGAT